MAADPDCLVVATWRLPGHSTSEVERVTVPAPRRRQVLGELRDALRLEGLFYLATCQRVLAAFLSDPRGNPDGPSLRAAVADVGLSDSSEAVAAPETHRSDGAFHHLARVACSLESFVPGEPQVLGQFKDAYTFCGESGLLTPQLNWVLQRVLHAAKHVRTRTHLFRGKVSTLPLALEVLRRSLDGRGRIAVVGSGKMGSRMAAALSRKWRPATLHLVSRSPERAKAWAAVASGIPWELDEFLRDPPSVDAIVLAEETERPFLTANIAARLLDGATEGGLTVMDLALPRNCAPEVRSLDGVRLVQMDDLAREAEKGKAVRTKAEKEAETLLRLEVGKLLDRARRQGRDCRIGLLKAEILDAGKARLDALPPGLAREVQSNPAFLKWYEQSLKAVAHVSMKRTREILAEVGAYEDD